MTRIARGDCPPASLVILGFNQERFIAQAVEAAFGQDYPDLDIVLSDDGSRDRTFEIMRALADAYRGPHRVRVNRTAENRGTLAHVYEAAALSTGALIVFGAGDDVSYPHRVSRLIETWRATAADGLYSGYDRIDDVGRVFESYQTPRRTGLMPAYFPGKQVALIHGASSAYSRAVFERIAPPPERLLFEDTFFTLMLALRSRRVAYVAHALLGYRQHEDSITHGIYSDTGLDAVRARERRSAMVSGWFVDVLSCFERAARTGEGIDPDWGAPAAVDFSRVRHDLAFNRYRRDWMDGSVADLIGAMTHVRQMDHVRWLLPRVFGPAGLARLKAARAALRGNKPGT